jgi:site-specific DNA recombinase
MKVAGYLRVSTEAQAGEDRFGLAAQREAIEAYARREGHEIVTWYADEGISGATLDRQGLQGLLEAPTGILELVLVAKMDRIARDLMAQLWIEKELMKRGVELVSVAEPFRGQDPANVLFRQIIGAFAQFEKARITERMTGGRRQKARQGGYAGGGGAIGYVRKRGTKALAVDMEKAQTVRRVFEIKGQHPRWSLSRIARALNTEGHTTARGEAFSHVQVGRILANKSLYVGQYHYAGIEAQGQHEPVLTGR